LSTSKQIIGGVVCQNLLLRALVKTQAANFKVSIKNDIEKCPFFDEFILIIINRIALLNNDILRLNMQNLKIVDHFLHELSEFFFSLIWVNYISVGIVKVLNFDVLETHAELIAHPESQGNHVW